MARKGLQTVVMLQSERCINGQVSTEARYYISSFASHAAKISTVIRTHWTVENHLHWVLDVSFDEDACRIRKDHAPQNLSLLRHIALNLLGKINQPRRALQPSARRQGGMMPISSEF